MYKVYILHLSKEETCKHRWDFLLDCLRGIITPSNVLMLKLRACFESISIKYLRSNVGNNCYPGMHLSTHAYQMLLLYIVGFRLSFVFIYLYGTLQ